MFHTSNPYTGNPIAEYKYISDKDLLTQIEKSWQAFQEWNRSSLHLRSQLLACIAHNLRSSAEKLALIMTTEMGKPLIEALAEVEKSAFTLDYVSQNIGAWINPGKIPQGDSKFTFETQIQGLGPLFCIMPWNFPVWQLTRAMLSGLVVGNSVLYKGSDLTAGTNILFQEICQKALDETALLNPKCRLGLIQNLQIDHQQAAAVIAHPQVRGMTFTGSTRGGREVAAVAGKALKKTVLELGGNDAYLVLEDADLKRAGKICAESRLLNTGQSCIAAKRFFVPTSCLDEFLQAFVTEMSGRVAGDPRERTTNLGVLARKDFVASTLKQKVLLLEAGARVIAKAKYTSISSCFYQPEVLECNLSESIVHQAEIFAPSALVFPYKDLKACVDAINSSSYGLGAAIFSKDLERAKAISEEIQVGMIAINDYLRSDVRLPFGGVKESGYGRELSQFGILEFANRRACMSPRENF